VSDTTEYKGIHYPSWHGSPFDRGSADSWYSRKPLPHYYPEGTGNGDKIIPPQMNKNEIASYIAGYEFNEAEGGKKDWE